VHICGGMIIRSLSLGYVHRPRKWAGGDIVPIVSWPSLPTGRAMGPSSVSMGPCSRFLLWPPCHLCRSKEAHRISTSMPSIFYIRQCVQCEMELIVCLQEFVAIQTLYFLNTTLTKISILLLYYRIFGVVNNFRIALYIAAALVIAYWIPTTILAYLGCTPFARNWDQTLPGTCVNLVAFFRWNGICNLILDVLILCLPIPMVWRLSVSVRQRLELSGIFLLGAL